MFSNFALHPYMTLSSVDNTFKQFGSRSGPTFFIEVQNVWHFRGYDKLKLNLYFNLPLNFHVTLLSAYMHFKQFGLRSGLTFCPVYFFSTYKLYLKLSSAFNLCKHDTSIHRTVC